MPADNVPTKALNVASVYAMASDIANVSPATMPVVAHTGDEAHDDIDRARDHAYAVIAILRSEVGYLE